MSSQQKIRCYFDNNATTIKPKEVIDEVVKWMNMGNPSANYFSAKRCQNLIQTFRDYIAKVGGFKVSFNDTKNINSQHYRIIFTSCASESNALIIRSVVDSYIFNTGTIPHIISSQIEHKSILETLKQLESEGRTTVTLIPPNAQGFISHIDIEKELRPNTALCSIMAANNETGAIMDIKKISLTCHKHNVPFHSDAVQIFGKYPIRPVADNIDAYSVSFHKLHGPIGTGMLVVKEEFLRGYKLKGQIGGTQNEYMRGGTMNVSGLAGAFEGMKLTIPGRLRKNEAMRDIKRNVIAGISSRIPSKMYREYLQEKLQRGNKPAMEVIFMSTAEKFFLPNTLLLSVVKRTKPDMCNVKLKSFLCDHGIIVSVGSACNTSSENASHVLTAMDADPLIKRGTIRVSFGDETTIEQSNIFIQEFIKYLNRINKI